jgi:hypothetical protein
VKSSALPSLPLGLAVRQSRTGSSNDILSLVLPPPHPGSGTASLSFTARIERAFPAYPPCAGQWGDSDCGRRTKYSCQFYPLPFHLGVAGMIPTARVGRAPSILFDRSKLACFSLLEGHPCWFRCGRRTRPFSGRAFREHRTNVGVIPSPSSCAFREQTRSSSLPSHTPSKLARSLFRDGG